MGGQVPFPDTPRRLPNVPSIPECYAFNHPARVKRFPPEVEKLYLFAPPAVNGRKWRHESDHDMESIFWLMLHWAMTAKPKGKSG